MGRKLVAREAEPPSGIRGELCARFRQLTEGMTIAEIADACDCSHDMARKYLRCQRYPAMEQWPVIAENLGLPHWLCLLGDVEPPAQ